jgi:hypothetical protein
VSFDIATADDTATEADNDYVGQSLAGQSIAEGDSSYQFSVTVNGDNHHIAKTALIGKIGPDGLIYTEWSSDGPIEPDPFLEGYDWAEGLS